MGEGVRTSGWLPLHHLEQDRPGFGHDLAYDFGKRLAGDRELFRQHGHHPDVTGPGLLLDHGQPRFHHFDIAAVKPEKSPAPPAPWFFRPHPKHSPSPTLPRP